VIYFRASVVAVNLFQGMKCALLQQQTSHKLHNQDFVSKTGVEAHRHKVLAGSEDGGW